MTLSKGVKNFGRRCGDFFDVALPRGAKLKALEEVVGQGPGTARRLSRGEAPTVPQILSLAQHFGRDFVDYVFADVLPDTAEREERVGRYLKAARVDRAEALHASVENRAFRNLVDRRPRGVGRLDARETGSEAPRLVSERLPLDRIGGSEALLPHLDRWRSRLGRMETSEVVAWARADSTGRSGVVSHTAGDGYRFAYRPRAGTLISPFEQIVGKPITEGSPASYHAMIEKTCIEAETSAEPVFARLRGPVARTDGRTITTDVGVLRLVFRSNRRESSILSTFVPLNA